MMHFKFLGRPCIRLKMFYSMENNQKLLKPWKTEEKTMGNHPKTMENNQNNWKLWKTEEDHGKSHKNHENQPQITEPIKTEENQENYENHPKTMENNQKPLKKN